MSVLDTLITDRTGPGPYDWNDFDRVQAAVAYLTSEFSKRGYLVPTVWAQEWTRSGVPFASQCAAYLANVQALRDAIDQLPATPPCPESMAGWTWTAANDLEQILADLEDALRRLDLAATVPCGPATCGGDYF